MSEITLSQSDIEARHLKRSEMVAERVAFIDCKMPGSHLKENYSLIGPGVTQSASQVVSLTEPHGFSLGVAAMPAGITNNLHIHYTAEVFMIYQGRWVFRWGADGKDGEIVGEPGDVVSIPTWIFRGFSNVGDSDGWIFTALGGDDTGGIIWHPTILKVAAEHGLYLTKSNMMVDTQAGAPKPRPDELVDPVDDAALSSLRRYSVEEMRRRVVQRAERRFSATALLDSVIDGHGAEIAPVLGHGITQDREQDVPIGNPHGFSIEWLRIPAGGGVGRHRLSEKQILIVFAGAVEVGLNDAGNEVAAEVSSQDVFSFPADAWRSIRSIGDTAAECILMTAGDHKKRIVWSGEVLRAAATRGRAIDHNGYVAPLKLLPPSVQDALAPLAG